MLALIAQDAVAEIPSKDPENDPVKDPVKDALTELAIIVLYTVTLLYVAFPS